MRYLGCMILTIYYLNSQEIYHRDLKPANFLIHKVKSSGKKYLHANDFGTAKKANDIDHLLTTEGRNVGTLLYMAPEYLNRDLKAKGLKFDKQDVWAIGMIAYVLRTLRIPFSGSKI